MHSHPGTIQVHPQRTKTHSQNPFQISIPRAAEPVLDTYYWLAAVVATSCVLGQPITGYIVRSSATAEPTDASVACFSEKSLSKSGLHSRLVSQLKIIGAYNGESLHSFRRGMAQHTVIECGQPKEQTMDQMILQTKRILDTVYLPVHRQQTGIKRLRCASGQARPATL